MNKTYAVYALSILLLGLSIYLKSPLVAISSVILIALDHARDILLKLQENKLVEALRLELGDVRNVLSADRTRLESVEKELANAIVRIRESLGESF